MQQESRYIADVYEDAVKGIVITDAEGKILSVNSAYLHMTGFSEEECLHRTPSLYADEKKSSKLKLSVKSRLELEGHWSGEVEHRRKDEKLTFVWLSISSVYDDEGKIKQYVYTFIDLDQGKIAPKTLRLTIL